MTLICMSSARDFSFLRYACRRHVARDGKRGERDRKSIGRVALSYAEMRSLKSLEMCRMFVATLHRITTYAKFRKRACPGYVYPMIQRHSTDRRPWISRRPKHRASDRLAPSRDEQTLCKTFSQLYLFSHI